MPNKCLPVWLPENWLHCQREIHPTISIHIIPYPSWEVPELSSVPAMFSRLHPKVDVGRGKERMPWAPWISAALAARQLRWGIFGDHFWTEKILAVEIWLVRHDAAEKLEVQVTTANCPNYERIRWDEYVSCFICIHMSPEPVRYCKMFTRIVYVRLSKLLRSSHSCDFCSLSRVSHLCFFSIWDPDVLRSQEDLRVWLDHLPGRAERQLHVAQLAMAAKWVSATRRREKQTC